MYSPSSNVISRSTEIVRQVIQEMAPENNISEIELRSITQSVLDTCHSVGDSYHESVVRDVAKVLICVGLELPCLTPDI